MACAGASPHRHLLLDVLIVANSLPAGLMLLLPLVVVQSADKHVACRLAAASARCGGLQAVPAAATVAAARTAPRGQLNSQSNVSSTIVADWCALCNAEFCTADKRSIPSRACAVNISAETAAAFPDAACAGTDFDPGGACLVAALS